MGTQSFIKKAVLAIGLFVMMPGLVFGQSDLFLLIGQSNMAGRATIETVDTTTLSSVFLLNDKGEFELAQNPLNQYSTVRKDLSSQRLGPGYTFARTVQSYYQDTVLLVVNARGGTALKSWLKGATDGYYEAAIERVRAAQQVSPNARLKAIIWHQGESNRDNYAHYLSQLRKMVSDFRRDLDVPDLPFIAGDIGQWNGDYTEIREKIAMIPDSIPNAWLVSSDDLKNIDEHHFDSRSQRKLGRRYALKYIEAESGIKIQARDTTICVGVVIDGKDKTGDYWLDDKQSFLALEVNADSTFLDVVICEKQSYRGFAETGYYYWTEASEFGCNKYFELNLTVVPVDTVHIDTVLVGVPEYMGYTTSGSYWRKYISSNQCDSLVHLNLTFSHNLVTGVSDTNRPRFYVQGNRLHFPEAANCKFCSLTVLDILGRVVYHDVIKEETPPLRSGIYVLRFTGSRELNLIKIFIP